MMYDEPEGYTLASSTEEAEHLLKLELLNFERANAVKRHERTLDEMRLKDQLNENQHKLDVEELNLKQEVLKAQHRKAERVRQLESQMENLAHEREMEKVKLEIKIKQLFLEKAKLQNEENDRRRDHEIETAEKEQERNLAKLREKIDGDETLRTLEINLETERMRHVRELSKLVEDLEDECHKKQRSIQDMFQKEMQEKRRQHHEEMTKLLTSIATINIVTGERRKFIKIRKKARMRDLFRKVREEVFNGVEADFTLVFHSTNLDENATGDVESHGIQSLNTIAVMLRMRGGRYRNHEILAAMMKMCWSRK